MSLPSPDNLFLNVWSREMFDEDNGLRPGTESWETNKKAAYAHWTKIWIECRNVCVHIQEFEELSQSCKGIVNEARETPEE